jgi:hypothetical protein
VIFKVIHHFDVTQIRVRKEGEWYQCIIERMEFSESGEDEKGIISFYSSDIFHWLQ